MTFAARRREKIWDHCAGFVIVEEAGGRVTDAGGTRLDFSKGRYLQLDRCGWWWWLVLMGGEVGEVPRAWRAPCAHISSGQNSRFSPDTHLHQALHAAARVVRMRRGIIAAPPAVHEALLKAVAAVPPSVAQNAADH